LLVAAIWVVQREVRHLRLEDVAAAIADIPLRALAVALGLTLLSYAILTFYDRLGTIYAGHKMSYGRVAFASFCAYALSHNLGFAAVSGAAVRFRLYSHWGLTPLQIGKVVVFCNLTFALGGLVLGGFILVLEPGAVPFFGEHLPLVVMRGIGAAMWATAGAYIVFSRVKNAIRLFGHEVPFPQTGTAGLQVLLASIDVAVTAAIVYALLPAGTPPSYPRLLAVYVASYSAGLATNLPGGIGVFDSAMLLGLSPYLPPADVVGAILIFRLYYYIIPLLLAGTLFAGNEVLLRSRSALQARLRGPRMPAVGRWSEPDFAVAAATGMVALCGTVLLSLSALAPPPDVVPFDRDLADVAAVAGWFVLSLIGAALLVLAIGLARRVKLAWAATIVLLLAAAAFTLLETTRLWIPAVLVLATFVLAPYRTAFYRHARLLAGPLDVSTAVPLLALVVCVLMLSGFEHRIHGIAAKSWWEIVLSHDTPNALRVNVAATVAAGLVAIWRLIRPGRVGWSPWNTGARLSYAALGGNPPVTADGLLLGEAGRAALPFRRMSRVLLGIGDPIGAESDRISAIWRLRDLAEQEGLHPAAYRAGRGFLKVYRDIGLTAIPLGPDGLPLPDLDEEHATEFLVCRTERDLAFVLPFLPDRPAR
jgi:uncharacterized membrane protein YbhN (UPF0104 family)